MIAVKVFPAIRPIVGKACDRCRASADFDVGLDAIAENIVDVGGLHLEGTAHGFLRPDQTVEIVVGIGRQVVVGAACALGLEIALVVVRVRVRSIILQLVATTAVGGAGRQQLGCSLTTASPLDSTSPQIASAKS